SGENDRCIGVLAGVRAVAGPNIQIEQADGVWISKPNATSQHPAFALFEPVPDADNLLRIAEAEKVAARADVVLLVLGDNPQVTGESIAGARDRDSLDLFGLQNQLVDAILATGKPV